MKRILFYTDTPLLGGAENQMLLLAKYLPLDEFEVTLACSKYQNLNPWCQKFLAAGVKVQRLNVSHKHDPRHFFYLKKMLPNFDLLHLHIWNPGSGRYGFLAGGKKPIVITEHDPFALKGVKGWLKKKFLQKTSAIIVTSNAAKALVVEQDASIEEKIVVVPNGIDVDEVRSQSQLENRSEFRRLNFHTTQPEIIVLCVAELHERKGQKFLIEAVLKLAEVEPRLKLVFIGDGPARRKYEKLASGLEKRMLFLGRKKDVPKFMAAADIFVLPSIREAFGLVLIEAGVCGLPVIASRVGGIPEIIEDMKSGLLTEAGNATEIAEALELYIKSPEQSRKFAQHLKSQVEEKFYAKLMAERTAQVYNAVLQTT